MEETLLSQKMAKIDLINNLEKISSEIPNRILKLEGFILKENQKEQLEILIFRGFSSSTTHPIEIDSEKKVIGLTYIISNFKLYKAPLTETEVNYLPEDKVVEDSLTWLSKFGNEDVDLFKDWIIVSNFKVVSDFVNNSLTIENNELGKIQVSKAYGQKCDRCWHYQKETFNGIQDTKLCKRCSNIINLEFT